MKLEASALLTIGKSEDGFLGSFEMAAASTGGFVNFTFCSSVGETTSVELTTHEARVLGNLLLRTAADSV